MQGWSITQAKEQAVDTGEVRLYWIRARHLTPDIGLLGCCIVMFQCLPNTVLSPSESDLIVTFQPQQGRQKEEPMLRIFQKPVFLPWLMARRKCQPSSFQQPGSFQECLSSTYVFLSPINDISLIARALQNSMPDSFGMLAFCYGSTEDRKWLFHQFHSSKFIIRLSPFFPTKVTHCQYIKLIYRSHPLVGKDSIADLQLAHIKEKMKRFGSFWS